MRLFASFKVTALNRAKLNKEVSYITDILESKKGEFNKRFIQGVMTKEKYNTLLDQAQDIIDRELPFKYTPQALDIALNKFLDDTFNSIIDDWEV